MRDMSCTEVTDDGQRDKRSQLPNQYKPQSAMFLFPFTEWQLIISLKRNYRRRLIY